MFRDESREILVAHLIRSAFGRHDILVLGRIAQKLDELLLDLSRSRDVDFVDVGHRGRNFLKKFLGQCLFLVVRGILVRILIGPIVAHVAEYRKLIAVESFFSNYGRVMRIHPNPKLFLVLS